jgi:hypothetical protein
MSVLPDKIACFLYKYHDTSYASLGLPPIPLDRSNISVHSILQSQLVEKNSMKQHNNIFCLFCIFCILLPKPAYCAYCAYFIYSSHMWFRTGLCWTLCVFVSPITTRVTFAFTPPYSLVIQNMMVTYEYRHYCLCQSKCIGPIAGHGVYPTPWHL